MDSFKNKRKRNDVNSCVVEEDATFYVIKGGQKVGPLNFEQVKSMIAAEEVIVTDFVSVDNGINWLNIYRVANFDRRAKSIEKLPGLPSWDVFIQSNEYISEKLSNKHSKNRNAVDAIASLAFMENAKAEENANKKNLEQYDNREEEDPLTPINRGNSMTKFLFASAVVAGLFAFIFLSNDDDTSTKPRPKISKTVRIKNNKRAVKLIPKKQLNKKSSRRFPSSVSKNKNRHKEPQRDHAAWHHNDHREREDGFGNDNDEDIAENQTENSGQENDEYEYGHTDAIELEPSKVTKTENRDQFDNNDGDDDNRDYDDSDSQPNQFDDSPRRPSNWQDGEDEELDEERFEDEEDPSVENAPFDDGDNY